MAAGAAGTLFWTGGGGVAGICAFADAAFLSGVVAVGWGSGDFTRVLCPPQAADRNKIRITKNRP